MIKAAIITLFLSWLPITDNNVKMQLGMILSELAHNNYFSWIKNRIAFCKRKQITIPDQTKDKDFNPLFDKLQDYLSLKYSKMIESCELIPKNGDVEYSLKDITGKKFTDHFNDESNNDHTLEIRIETAEEDSKQGGRGFMRQIVISSKTASPDNIKAYVKKVSSIQLKNTNLIKIFRPIVHGKKKEDRTIEWESIMVRTNKTLENTIYSEEITRELFEDLERFVNNEEWYAKRGIPYKRGYFLYSTPGQGKTSVAKIVANKYGTPVFCLDLTTIEDNATMIKLMTELNYHTHQGKYVLLIEDAERTEFFNPRYKNPKLSMDCFLNVLDGVVEPHGRIIIMSANEPGCILENKAMMRPGRIDKTLELKSCDKYQIRKMYELFYSDINNDIDWENWEFDEDLSAAYIMKLLQENIGNPEIFMRIIGNAKTGDDKDIALDDTFKKVIADAKSEHKEINDDKPKKRYGRRGYRYSNKIEDKVANTKRNLNRVKKTNQQSAKQLEKLQSKLPALLEKLEEKKEKRKIAKLKEKAKAKLDYLKNKSVSIRMREQLEGYDEDEYETPAFLMNSIEEVSIPTGTITTYNLVETDNFVAPEILFGTKDTTKASHKDNIEHKKASPKKIKTKKDEQDNYNDTERSCNEEDVENYIIDTKKNFRPYVPPIRRSMNNKPSPRPNNSDTYDGSEEAED
jgi:ATP-dependent 26S proteasome regulatory subunit